MQTWCFSVKEKDTKMPFKAVIGNLEWNTFFVTYTWTVTLEVSFAAIFLGKLTNHFCKFKSNPETILVLIGFNLVIIWEMFHGGVSLYSTLLLLLVNFVSGFRLELMYISLMISIRSNLTYLHGFQLLVLLP